MPFRKLYYSDTLMKYLVGIKKEWNPSFCEIAWIMLKYQIGFSAKS